MISIKICGICRPEDAAQAARSGASHVGVILAENSRRSQTLASASAIYAAAPGLVRAGVFVDQDIELIRRATRELGLNIVQLHGSEPVEFVNALTSEVEVWKAVRVRAPEDVRHALDRYGPHVSALLLDGFDARHSGGSGTSFEWNSVGELRRGWKDAPALVLAGGLTPENVADAIAALNPDVVDVSSGVEESVGKKSAERIAAFVAAARGAITVERSS
jgi:phosphoribosylanthranilate isomerase